MHFRDFIYSKIKAAEYVIGTSAAKGFVKHVGSKCQIHYSVKYWQPSQIWIGDNCEIRHGTFLDARSDNSIAIKIGDGTRIKDYVGLATYGGKIHLGANVLIGRGSSIFGHGGVHIGSESMIGLNTVIISSDHLSYVDGTPFQSQGFTREAIKIEGNVWLGSNVCVLAGSHIHSDVVVGAGAVVQGILNSGWLYGGIPAKPIKQLEKTKPEELMAYTRDWDLFGL